MLDEIDALTDYHALRSPSVATSFQHRLEEEGYDGILYGNLWDEALRGSQCAIVFHTSQIDVVAIDTLTPEVSTPTLP